METEANNAGGILIGLACGLGYLFVLSLCAVAGRSDARALNAFEDEHGIQVDENADIDWPQEAA